MCYSEIKMMKYLPTSETADLVNQLFSSEKAYTAQRFQGSSLQIGTVKDSDMKSNIAVKAGFVCVCVGGFEEFLVKPYYMETLQR